MSCLRDTKDLCLTLRADGTGMSRWHIDAAFAVHQDFRSHTGGNMTMGKGSIMSASLKQKQNTRSSTESELAGSDDLTSQVLWAKLFLEAQGCNVKDNVIHQDDKSTILLQKNGHASAGKRSRHLNIKLFYITDLINDKQTQVECCPTDEMMANFMTKPKQGSAFAKLRTRIMNLEAS